MEYKGHVVTANLTNFPVGKVSHVTYSVHKDGIVVHEGTLLASRVSASHAQRWQAAR